MSSMSTGVRNRFVIYFYVLLCVGLSGPANATGVAVLGDPPPGLWQNLPSWIDGVGTEAARYDVAVRQHPPRNLGIQPQRRLGWQLGCGLPVMAGTFVGIMLMPRGTGEGQEIAAALLAILVSPGAGLLAGMGLVALFPPRIQYSYDLTATSTVSGRSLSRRCTWTKSDPSVKLADMLPALLIDLEGDRTRPDVVLGDESYITSEESAYVAARVTDDVAVGTVTVEHDGRTIFRQEYGNTKNADVGAAVALRLGANRISVTAQDWCGRQARAPELTVTRVRQSEAQHAGVRAGEPPDVAVEAVTLDGNNTVVGGREEGVKVTVTNNGKGIAKWVRVQLEGDRFLTKQWGSERNLEDIKPGENKTAMFSLLMPTELERRQVKLRVVVKEGRGYSPIEVPELTLNLVPAEKTSTQVEVVEAVDNGIPAVAAKRPGSSALIVGVSAYKNMPLKYARKDAEVFRQYATKVLGISEVKELLDEDATGGKVRGFLQDWMRKKRGLKVVFFAGHGTANPENLRDRTPYLVPYDGDLDLISTLVSAADVPGWCSSEKDTLLLVYDACMAGGDRPLVAVEVPEQGAITLAATEGDKPSKEFEKAQHGYFTYYTLLGLKGKADANNDGWVTTTELYNYVKKNVSDATNEVQVPVLRPEREMRLGRVK